jgi:hypothetical protein
MTTKAARRQLHKEAKSLHQASEAEASKNQDTEAVPESDAGLPFIDIFVCRHISLFTKSIILNTLSFNMF